jgi:hypothetical protein
VLFRMMASYIGPSKRTHVSVQLTPFKDLSPEKNRAALAYLKAYFGELNIRVYWGTCEQFVAELKSRLDRRRFGPIYQPPV